MDVDVRAGRYVIAVSGGVDSVALLHELAGRPGLRLIIAHFDHGIRADSAADRRFVQSLARRYGLEFVYGTAQLGPGASEAAARSARYAFLHKARESSGSQAIILAHHHDDVLETAIINILRGTGRRGLSSLASTADILRPLLGMSKADLVRYARSHGLEWREDSTNADQSYLRNYVRQQILPRLDAAQKQLLSEHLDRAMALNNQIDGLIESCLNRYVRDGTLDRRAFIGLSHAESMEIMAAWLRAAGIMNYNRRSLERLTVAAKTGRSGSRADVTGGYKLLIGRTGLDILAGPSPARPENFSVRR